MQRYRFLLAPRWLAGHATLVAVVVAFGLLGWWQLGAYRLYDQQRDRRVDPTPVPLVSVAGAGQPLRADAVGRTVVVEGGYDAGSQLLVPGRELDGRDGLHVVTPLVTANGAVVAVRRGWVASADDPAARAPAGAVTVTGVLQPSETEASAGDLARDRALPAGQLPFLATPELMRQLDYAPERLVEGYVALGAQQPPAVPAPQVVPAEAAPEPAGGASRWQSFSYALQWWLFAGAAVFFWRLFVRNAATPAPSPAPPAPHHHSR